jgi:hypothetical protein
VRCAVGIIINIIIIIIIIIIIMVVMSISVIIVVQQQQQPQHPVRQHDCCKLTGNREADEDIKAFYRARCVLLICSSIGSSSSSSSSSSSLGESWCSHCSTVRMSHQATERAYLLITRIPVSPWQRGAPQALAGTTVAGRTQDPRGPLHVAL